LGIHLQLGGMDLLQAHESKLRHNRNRLSKDLDTPTKWHPEKKMGHNFSPLTSFHSLPEIISFGY
jgi:hypothetical protein